MNVSQKRIIFRPHIKIDYACVEDGECGSKAYYDYSKEISSKKICISKYPK